MPRLSDDPYGDFAVRVMNSARLARAQADGMSEGEAAIVEAVRETLLRFDPEAVGVAKANIIIRRKGGS